MTSRLRIAVLECDVPLTKTVARYGGYKGVFADLLHSGAKEVARADNIPEPQLEITAWDIVTADKYPHINDVDGILLTGSRHDAYRDDSWIIKLVDFTKEVLQQQRVRLIGVCFGHQIIGRALGVKVDRGTKGWETSVLPMQLTPKGQQLFGLKEVVNLHQMHRDIVYELPPSTESLGHSAVCDVQGFYTKGRLITVQGHPEFTGDIVEEILQSRHERGIFNDAEYKEAISRVRNPHDGIAVGAAFIRFLLEP